MQGPVAQRDDVVGAAFLTSASLAVAGEGVRRVSTILVNNAISVPDLSAALPLAPASSDLLLPHLAAAAAVAAAVTAARAATLAAWPEFKSASDASNRQTLTMLGTGDIVFISALSGVGEEWLFRGALLPAIGVEWPGVAIAALVFGGLHVTGGRNAAYAAWASAVGLAYGALALWSHDLVTPMAAHALGNLASGLLFKAKESPSGAPAPPPAAGAGDAAGPKER